LIPDAPPFTLGRDKRRGKAVVKKVGPYDIHQSLGQGALGMVYRAIDDRDGSPVALKLVRKDVLSEPECDDLLRRFQRDVEITGGLDHAHVLRALEAGETDEVLYIATELVAGGRLADLPLGSLSVERVVALFLQLLDALSFLHAQGIVHRDIHPVGLLVTTDGLIKLSNFGAAQGTSLPLVTGGVIGTPPYLAPEQLLGVPVDARADLYAVGSTLFHAVTGKKPYEGSLAEVMAAMLESPVPRPSQINAKVPASLDLVLIKAMAKHPDDRYRSAEEFAAALRHAVISVPARRPAPREVLPDLGDGPDGARRHIHLLLVRGLDGTVTPHLADLRREIAVALDQPASTAQRDALAQMLEVGAQALNDMVLAHAPLPGQPSAEQRTDWMDTVHLFDTVRAALVRLGRGDQVEPLVHGLARDLTVTALLYLNEVNRQVLSPDHVELGHITANLIRLDVLEWALEVLNAREAVRDLRISSRMIAGQVLRKVSATIRGFIDFPDDTARFDVAGVLVDIEALIALADRTIEDDPQLGATTDRSYAKVMGREIVADFIEAARRLAAFIADELMGQIGESGCDMVTFAAKLRHVGRLHQFAVRVEDRQCRPLAMRLTEEVRISVDSLAADIVAALHEAGGPASALLYRQLTAVHDVAVEQGWNQFAEDLLGALRESLLEQAEGA